MISRALLFPSMHAGERYYGSAKKQKSKDSKTKELRPKRQRPKRATNVWNSTRLLPKTDFIKRSPECSSINAFEKEML